MTTVREYILDEAKKCVMKDRNLDYDEPEKNFEDIARFWNIYLQGKEEIEPHDTAVMAILIKIARIRKSPHVEDHWTDIAGYAACGAECALEKEKEVYDSPYFYPGGVSVYAWGWEHDSGEQPERQKYEYTQEYVVWKE